MRDDGAVLRFSGDTLSAVETINDAKTHMQARKILAGAKVTRVALDAVDYDFAFM